MMLGRLLAHTSNYTVGSLLVAIAGFVSFPILTRILTVSEYGLLSLINMMLLLLIGLSKLGVQHSIARFYAEVKAGKTAVDEPSYVSTVVYGMAGTAVLVAIVFTIVGQLVPDSWWGDQRVQQLFGVIALLTCIRVIDSALTNLLRAQQRSGLFSTYNVLRRYGSLAIVLLTLFYLVPGLNGFYLGTVAAETVALVVLGLVMFRRQPLRVAQFSMERYRPMLVFGIPMIAYEVAGVVLGIGDRYVIQRFLGSEALGAYAAAYNLCEYVQTILIVSFGQALVPMYTRIWEEQGEGACRSFIARALHFFLAIAAIVVAGLAAVGHDVLTILASKRYSEGSSVIPWVISGLVIDGMIPLLAAAIFIHKQTKVLMWLVLGAAVLNMALNIALVPRIGIIGAAVATLVSYVGLALGAMHIGAKQMRIVFPWGHALKFGLLAFVTFLVLESFQLKYLAADTVAKLALGAACYTALVLAFDKRSRELVSAGLERLRVYTA